MDGALYRDTQQQYDKSKNTPTQLVGGNMTVLDIIDRSFRIYRKHFLPLVTISAIVTVPVAIFTIPISVLQMRDPTSPAVTSFTALAGIISVLAALVQVIFMQTTLAQMASEMHFGNKVTIREAFDTVRPRLGTVTVTYLLLGIVFIGIIITVVVLSLVTVGFGALFGMPFIFYYFTCISYFLIPIITLETVEPMQAINRAYRLGKQRFWRGYGLTILLSLITTTQSITLITLSQITFLPIESTGYLEFAVVVQVIAQTLIQIFTTPISIIALVIFYYDTRVRLEGLDISFYLSRFTAPRPVMVPSPMPGVGFINGRDVANIFILLGGIVSVALFAVGFVYLAALLVGY